MKNAFRTSCLAILLFATIEGCAQLHKFPLSEPVSIPFTPVQRLVMLPVTVNGSRPLWFVLDTGNKYTVINLTRARELGLDLGKEIRVSGSGAQTTGAFVRKAVYSIAGLPRFSQPVTLAIPLDSLSSRLGHDFDGILGADFIGQFVVEIDYRAKRVRLHDRDAFRYNGTGRAVPIRLNSSGHPVFKAELTPIGKAPIAVDLVLDTGSSGALDLRAPFVAAHQLPGPGVPTIRQIGGAGAGGRTSGRIGRLKILKFDTFEFRDPVVVFSDDRSGANATNDTQGKIGARIAGRFKLFLDYAHDRIVFEPDSTLNDPFDVASAGLLIEATGPAYRTFRVTEVLENSPGAEAAMRVGDEIVAVDERPASSLTLTGITELIEHAMPYRLKVRRGEQIVDLTLEPRRIQ